MQVCWVVMHHTMQDSLDQASSIVDCDEVLTDNVQLLQCQRMLWVCHISDVLYCLLSDWSKLL